MFTQLATSGPRWSLISIFQRFMQRVSQIGGNSFLSKGSGHRSAFDGPIVRFTDWLPTLHLLPLQASAQILLSSLLGTSSSGFADFSIDSHGLLVSMGDRDTIPVQERRDDPLSFYDNNPLLVKKLFAKVNLYTPMYFCTCCIPKQSNVFCNCCRKHVHMNLMQTYSAILYLYSSHFFSIDWLPMCQYRHSNRNHSFREKIPSR